MTIKSIGTALTLGFLAFTVTPAQGESQREYRPDHADIPKGARCTWRGGTNPVTGHTTCLAATCGSDESDVGATKSGFRCTQLLCCKTADLETKTSPVGGGFEERAACLRRGSTYKYNSDTGACVKQIGNVVGECKKRGAQYHYDPQTGACVKTIARNKTPEACEAQGPNYHYDGQTGGCVKSIARNKTPEACEAQGPNYHYDGQTGGCVKTISNAKPEETSKQVEEQSSAEHSSNSGDDDRPHKKKKKRHHN